MKLPSESDNDATAPSSNNDSHSGNCRTRKRRLWRGDSWHNRNDNNNKTTRLYATTTIRVKDLLRNSHNDDNKDDSANNNARMLLLLELWQTQARCVRAWLWQCRRWLYSSNNTKNGRIICRRRNGSVARPLVTLLQLALDCGAAVAVEEQPPPHSLTTKRPTALMRLCTLLLAAQHASSSNDIVLAKDDNQSLPIQSNDDSPTVGHCSRHHHCRFTLLQDLLWSRFAAAFSELGRDEDHNHDDHNARNRAVFYFGFYAELLAECADYDHLSRLQPTVAPLLEHIERNILLRTRAAATTTVTTRPFLQSLAYLLSRRGSMMLAVGRGCRRHREGAGDDFHGRRLTALLQQLSLTFGRASDWIDPATTKAERERQVQALQAVGILGVCAVADDDDDADDSANDRANSTSSSSSWAPFAYEFGNLRSAAQRIEAWVPVPFFSDGSTDETTAPIFSPYSAVNAVPPSVLQQAAAAATPAAGFSVPPSPDSPTMDDLNDDLLQKVFSFLPHKRLVRLRTVGLGWKRNADANRLWRAVYESKYGLRSDDPRLLPDKNAATTTLEWKQLFVERWQAQQEIRFRRARTDPTWKVRICGYLGCLQVLSTPRQLQKHYQSHQKQQQQQQQQQCCGAKKRARMATTKKRKRPKDATT